MKISLQFLFIIGLATPVDSFFSFTNLLYKVHICGIIGCPDPVCDRPPHLPHHCHHDDDHTNRNGGSNNISSSRTDGTGGSNGVGSGSGGQSGNDNSGASGGSSSSSTNGSANGGTSGGGSGGSGSSIYGGNGDRSSSSSGNYNNGANGSNSGGSYYSNSNSGWSSGGSSSSNSNSGSRSWQNSNGNSGTSSWNSDFADYFGSSGGLSDSSYSMYMDGWVQCRLNGGCTNLYSQVCDGDNTCSYQMCQDGDEGCVYTCQSSGNCFRICDEDTDGEGCAEKVMNTLDNSFEILQECHQAGGCSGLYGYYCDENGNCAYQLCNDIYAGGCEYMCDIAMDCFQVCSEEEDGIGCAESLHDYYYYNGGTYSSKNGLSHVKEDWTWPTFIALLIAAVAALAMGLGCFASMSGAKNGSHNHPLKGSLGKRMKLFSRMAPKTPTPRDPTQYRRTKDDGTATTP